MEITFHLFSHNFVFHNSLAFMPSKKTSKVICDKKISKVSIKNLHNKAFINILIDYACIYVYFTCICISDVNNHFYISDRMEIIS